MSADSTVAMHKLLARQIRRYLAPLGPIPDWLEPFLTAVEEAYRSADADRQLVERSMETVSRELTARMEHVRTARGERDEVRQALSLLEAAIEGSDQAVLIVDLEGHVVRHSSNFLTLWPGAADAIARHDAEEVWRCIGTELDDATSFESARHVTESLPGRRDLTVRVKDGRRIELLAHPHRLEERTIGWVWRFRDVTERYDMESQLRHAHKMEAVGQIAGGIAHDFNNLLTTIRGNLSLLLSDRSDTDRGAHLREIELATERAADLTRQLLAYGRRQNFQVSTFGLDAVVKDLEPMLQRVLPNAVTIDLATEPASISADRGQLDQVLLNLVLNARAAMPNGGTLRLATGIVELTSPLRDRTGELLPSGQYAELIVADTGVGMTPDTLERVFEPFFSTRPLGQGAGLGLSMVYGIVRQSRGMIDIDSTPNKGTSVRILLPLAEATADAKSDPASAPNPVPARGHTILLAEDEPAVRRFLATVLSRAGHAVLEAENGRVGVELARQFGGPIDLVVSDVLMPELVGPDMVRELRKVRPTVPVLFISGFTGEHGADGSMQDIERSRYLPKPFSTQQLNEAVQRAMRAR
jgi:signal transduction histidine kinase/ActR/RegA family two-component response regulator